MMPVARTRLGLGVVSAVVIGLELGLMRGLSFQLWSHFAAMVISVALLGFGASGTLLTLLRRGVAGRERGWLAGLALAFSLSIPLAWWAVHRVPLDVQFLAWRPSQAGNILLVQFLLFVPFLLAGAFVGVALMDRPERIAGHYAANLGGSGAGAVAAVPLMYVLGATPLLTALAWAAFAAAALLVSWRRRSGAAVVVAAGAALVLVTAYLPMRIQMSPYKMLAQARTWGGTTTLAHAEGPLGRIDVVAGPAIHFAPGLSLPYAGQVPPHVLMITDGDQTSPVYDCKRPEEWAFLDYTTAAVAYHVRPGPRVCVIGAGGGADIGLALYHRSLRVIALEMNSQVIGLMTGPLADRGGGVYRAPGVSVINQEARGYFASSGEKFDVIQLPALDAFGAAGAGLYASQESYLYTVEAFEAALDHLAPDGVLCVTRWARVPPREELRAFDTAAEALRRRGLDPSRHLAMIRSWATVTVVAFVQPISAQQIEAVREFCRGRSFDLCWLPGLEAGDANRYHRLEQPYYYEGCVGLLGPQRERFLADYAFDVAAATDAKPYFFHSFRWRSLPALAGQLRGTTPAFLEVGYLVMVAGLAQAVVLALVLILLPLAPGVGAIRGAAGKASVFVYFLLLGAGFMLLEMGFLQKLILYLAHPIYSAAAVIASFLIFSGLGSQLSGYWQVRRAIAWSAAGIVVVAGLYVLGMDAWLRATQSQPVWVRFLVAGATIAPLAVLMGQMFPAGLRLVGGASPGLVPWAWAVNGFASVVATVAAPLVAMQVGLPRLALMAMACYATAGVVGRRLGGRRAISA
jgi:uncharacterized protein (DUF983 family)